MQDLYKRVHHRDKSKRNLIKKYKKKIKIKKKGEKEEEERTPIAS